jgi:PiT family inorganic phosphate transporter
MQTVTIAFWIVALLVVLALLFDFMNGFHDAANSIATVVSTGVLKPHQAVVWAAFFNFWRSSSFSSRWLPRSARAPWMPAWSTTT